jgi:hypothetical protein
VQLPFTHEPPVGQRLPHAPQFWFDVHVSTQTEPPFGPVHAVRPGVHPAAHWPFTHWLPGPQRTPHPPQLLGLVCVSTH